MKLVVGLGNYGVRYQDTRHNVGFKVVDAFVRTFDSVEWKHERALSAFILKSPPPHSIPELDAILRTRELEEQKRHIAPKETAKNPDTPVESEKIVKKTKILPQEVPWIFMKSDGFMNHSGTPVARVCHFFKILTKDVIVVCDELTLPLGDVKITDRPGTAGHNGVCDILAKIGPGFTRFRVGIGAKTQPKMDLADYVLSGFNPQENDHLTRQLSEICADLKLLLDKDPVTAMNSINRKVCRQDHIELR
ncbi:MAG: aminoacyl-tRNA hydrolase [Verrucomicrobiota bacterium]|nr:MAG: aminoacyl-tRNA hydrolase [Verrucomicrobiota bacterium]